MEDPRSWIKCDETAKEMLARLAAERPTLLLPPLHRVPLRTGNIVEIVGPSPSAKSEVLLQAAVHCILPQEWNGVHFGGLERPVMYLDLDCRFDVLRLAQRLKLLLMQGTGTEMQSFDDELFQSCLKRFLYMRCYNSSEFLASLKEGVPYHMVQYFTCLYELLILFCLPILQTLRHQLLKEKETYGLGVHLLMIDSINAFYWLDRAHQPLPQTCSNIRKSLSLQSITETTIQELHKLLEVQPMLVLATKATILGFDTTNKAQRNFRNYISEGATDMRISSGESTQKYLYREYMPSVWQLFVTHRIFLRVSDENYGVGNNETNPVYVCEWVLPQLHFSDRFIIKDVGLVMIP